MKAHLPKLVLATAALLGCGRGEPAQGAGPAPSASAADAPKVLARVNGVPITELDVELRLKNDNHEAAPGPDRAKAVLDQLVTREAAAQKAAAEGLDRDPTYLAGLRKLEAQVEAYRRQELSERLFLRESERRAPTEDDARAYFEKNASRIRTELHVLQILKRSEAAIMEARAAIEGGKSFEEVAKEQFPGLPEGQAPWDLGYLSFQKIPEPWRATVYDLKPGEMSGILRGPNERYWLVEVVDAKVDPGVRFESVKDAVLADMKANRVLASREALESEVRKGARVEIVTQP